MEPDARAHRVLRGGDGVMRDKCAIRTSLNKLPLCGCGSSVKMHEIVRDVLARAAQPYVDGQRRASMYDPMPEHDLSGVAVEFVAQALSQTGHLEHGSSVGGCWLSGAGRLVLDFLRKYGCEDGGLGDEDAPWPQWATSCGPDEEFELSPQAWRELTMDHGGHDPVDPSPESR